MKKFYFLILIILLVEPVFAMRCGNLLVDEGDYRIDVIERCGNPDHISERTEYRFVKLQKYSNAFHYGQQVPVYIEEWTFNFGPRRFMRLLRFENGQLISIRTLSYGYRKRLKRE